MKKYFIGRGNEKKETDRLYGVLTLPHSVPTSVIKKKKKNFFNVLETQLRTIIVIILVGY